MEKRVFSFYMDKLNLLMYNISKRFRREIVALESRIIVCSDVHYCHIDWYGVSCSDRLNKMVQDINDYKLKKYYEKILFLGDYSLDFWAWDIGGSYVRDGISNTSNFIDKIASKLDAPYYMLPGNHEQYGNKKWKEITGNNRQDAFFSEDTSLLSATLFPVSLTLIIILTVLTCPLISNLFAPNLMNIPMHLQCFAVTGLIQIKSLKIFTNLLKTKKE